jgi:hypothetical protein
MNPVGGCGGAPSGASGKAPSPASRKDACGKPDPVACFSAAWLHQAGVRRQQHAYGDAEFPAGAGPNANVYAERASTWPFLRRDRTAAARALGKLLRYVGEERVEWGTGSIWYGSSQDRSEAVRSFVIDPALGVRWGYRRLTPALKAKVLGLAGAAVYLGGSGGRDTPGGNRPIGRRTCRRRRSKLCCLWSARAN